MKIIVSHDIDHITAFEHKNMIVPKAIIRSSIEVLTRKITLKEYSLRYKELLINRWNNLDALMKYNKDKGIPSTFFIGVNNGLGLDYTLSNSQKWINKIQSNGFDIGVHGINYEDYERIKEEYDTFQKNFSAPFGIRMHYLRKNETTFKNMAKSNYLFDTTLVEDKNPYKIYDMWEFPLHIMDGHIMYQGKRWITKSLEEYKEITKRRISELESKDIQYLTFLFHDRYFNDSFLVWKEWYIWSMEYFESLGYEFISYNNAIDELENKS